MGRRRHSVRIEPEHRDGLGRLRDRRRSPSPTGVEFLGRMVPRNSFLPHIQPSPSNRTTGASPCPAADTPENAQIAHACCMMGATNATLAARFEVSRTTIDNWIATIPDFGDAVRKGREVADGAVVSALYARATGTQRTMTRVFCHKGEPVTVSYALELPPDVRACIFW